MPPNSNVASYDSLITNLTDLSTSTDNSPIIITGDFNLPYVNWNTLSVTSQASNLFCELVSLSQLIDTSTHIHGNIPDLILTNIEDSIHNVQIYPHENLLLKSDHFLISIDIQVTLDLHPCNNTIYTFDYSELK